MSKLLTLCFLLLNWSNVLATSQVEQLFDSKDFVQNPKIAERFWSRKENLLYGKSVILWNSQDFAALERMLVEQRDLERKAYLNGVISRGYVNLEDSLSYQAHQANLDRALAALPDIRNWVDIARAENGEKVEEQGIAEAPQKLPTAQPGTGMSLNDSLLAEPRDESTERDDKLKEYLASKQAAYDRKKRILVYAVALALSAIAGVWAYLWFRFYRPQVSACPKCGNRDKSMITASSPIKKGSSGTILKVRVRRKYYCRICGYKWVKRTR